METSMAMGKRIKNAFSIFIALLPVLSMYYSGIPGFNVADVILGLFMALMSIFLLFDTKKLVDHFRSLNFNSITILAYVLYVFMHAAVAVVVHRHDPTDVVIRSVRIIFYLLSAIILLPKLLDTHMFISATKAVSVMAAVFLLIQVLVYTMSGTVIRGFPSFLPLYSSEYSIFDYEAFYLMRQYRPTSLFLEPAHFSRYIAMVLPFFIKDFIDGKSKWLTFSAAVILTFSIILSTSSIGLLLAGVSWLFLIFIKTRECYQKKNIKILALLVVAMFVLVTAIVAFIPPIRFTIRRSLNFSVNSAFYARLGSFIYLFSGDNNIFSLIFGNGYGSVPGENVWMADLMYILYGTGIVGVSLIFFSYLKLLLCKYKSVLYNAAILITFMLLFVDDSFNSIIIVFILGIHYNVWENGKRE